MNVHVVTAAVLFLHLAFPALAESASIDRSPRQESNVPQTLARAGQKATSNQHHHQTISKTSGRKEMGLDGSGIEGGGERRQNERLNLISSLLKMSHRTADYWTPSRTLESYNGYKYQNYREIEQRDCGGVPRMMKSDDHEQTWWWDEPAQMEGESRRGVAFERDAWREMHDSAGWCGGGWSASVLASFTCITTCCHGSGWLVGGLGGRLARSSCRLTLRRSSSRARVSCSKRASCSFTEARMLAAERTS